jgi:hypothetical protein
VVPSIFMSPVTRPKGLPPMGLSSSSRNLASAPTHQVDVTSRKHAQFLERHAPYHVRRLPSRGVRLATHPYRTLWPLWAHALFLLGIAQ